MESLSARVTHPRAVVAAVLAAISLGGVPALRASLRLLLRRLFLRQQASGATAPGSLAAFAAIAAAAVGVLLRRAAAGARRGGGKLADVPRLQLASPLDGTVPKWLKLHGVGHWLGFCPSCKRPLDVRMPEESLALGLTAEVQPERRSGDRRCAYVITLWGESKSYVLGALVLGASIKRTGTPHSLVCMHTADVPSDYLALLKRVWDCREIEHVEAAENLSWPDQVERFEKVFTKLRGMSLVEFDKVLMMDIDLVVLSNIDDIFDLSAPAAMRRGNGSSSVHGAPLDGRNFFLGKDNGKWSWGQGTGINAGVMLWEPNEAVYRHMLAEVADPAHPEHVRGNGPEQDYLSRYWADAPWSHISVENNYQLHQMFFALNPHQVRWSERAQILQDSSRVRIVHFSGEPLAKPWHRVLNDRFAHLWPDRSKDREYTEAFAEGFRGYWLWIRRDPAAWAKAAEDKKWDGPLSYFSLGEDGRIYTSDGDGGLADLPEDILQNAMSFLERALSFWFDTYTALERDLGIDLAAKLQRRAVASDAATLAIAAPVSEADAAPTEKTWKHTWFATPEPVAAASKSAYAAAPSLRMRYYGSGGWQHEKVVGEAAYSNQCAKASVVCVALESGRTVIFNEPSGSHLPDAFLPDSGGEPTSGVFAKVVGEARHPRAFALKRSGFGGDSSAASKADEDELLEALRVWSSCVEDGATLLIAILGLAPEVIASVLDVLAPLGVPQGPVQPGCRALAAAGVVGEEVWGAAHASTDAAYASVPVLAAPVAAG
eukprot:TRINITY_DN25952_c0_g2_i1.p1 TRINITY_DN25952_c0_g2~~TRINITY_DN25952_c0_g2_i1.p1  ORF type:complete len:772 (-),score=167.33 TRINITY_DN25952_c0_g2_i1:58-2373(-)